MKTKTYTALAAVVLALMIIPGTAFGAAALTIGPAGTAGSVALGVNDFGQLNEGSGITVNGGVDNGVGPGALGLAIYLPATTAFGGHVAGYYDSTSPGCLCEGWGVSGSGLGSGAAVDIGSGSGGISNLTFDSFVSSATNIVSTVHQTAGGLKVVQDYHVALGGTSTNTFEATVTITNISVFSITNVTYRRVMDWDVPYTEFSEAVTIQGWPATNLVRSNDNGFTNANPLVAPSSIACPANANFIDCSPTSDHGALFDFNFGTLAAGESKTFKIFYGATLNETDAINALAGVGAEVYSLGQSDTSGGSFTAGTPATYFFGFAGVGGTVVSAVPEPSSLLLLAAPALLAMRRLKKKKA